MSAKANRILFFIAITGLGSLSWAQTQVPATVFVSDQIVAPTPTKIVRQKTENLLDFEAEVIEGEKKRPELFLDIKAGDGSVGSGLYLRPNFDDFFVVDKKRRPRFIKAK